MGPIKKGDRFLRVHRDGRGNLMTSWVKVLKAGRRWAYFAIEEYDGDGTIYPESPRFDMETLKIHSDSFSDRGRVYRTEAEFLADTRTERLWGELCRTVERYRYQRPSSLTDLDVLKAADALGFRLKEE